MKKMITNTKTTKMRALDKTTIMKKIQKRRSLWARRQVVQLRSLLISSTHFYLNSRKYPRESSVLCSIAPNVTFYGTMAWATVLIPSKWPVPWATSI
jgi:hypothetical protein